MNDILTIRPATRDDQPQILQLIDRVYREYGDQICLAGADADVLDIQQHYFDRDGMFWVLEGDEVLGTHAARLTGKPKECTFRRLYLHRMLRGTHWGGRLMQVALDWARIQGCVRVEFWSDTRFSRAHAFFSKFGFQADGRIRAMSDGHQPYREYYFWRDLDSQQTDRHARKPT